MSDERGKPSGNPSAERSAVTRARIEEARTRLAAQAGRPLNTGSVVVDPDVFFASEVAWTCESLQMTADTLTDVAYLPTVSFGTAIDLLDLAHMFQQAHDGQCP